MPYCARQDTKVLFAALAGHWDLDADIVESLRRITAEFTWSGERMVIRKGRESDLRLVHFIVAEEMKKDPERFEKNRSKINMLLHDDDL